MHAENFSNLILYQCARHTHTCLKAKLSNDIQYFSSNCTTSVIFRIIESKAKIFKFNVNLLLIKRDDFYRANMNNFTFYTEHSGETYASQFINSVITNSFGYLTYLCMPRSNMIVQSINKIPDLSTFGFHNSLDYRDYRVRIC
jgi:hypothetical protein